MYLSAASFAQIRLSHRNAPKGDNVGISPQICDTDCQHSPLVELISTRLSSGRVVIGSEVIRAENLPELERR